MQAFSFSLPKSFTPHSALGTFCELLVETALLKWYVVCIPVAIQRLPFAADNHCGRSFQGQHTSL